MELQTELSGRHKNVLKRLRSGYIMWLDNKSGNYWMHGVGGFKRVRRSVAHSLVEKNLIEPYTNLISHIDYRLTIIGKDIEI